MKDLAYLGRLQKFIMRIAPRTNPPWPTDVEYWDEVANILTKHHANWDDAAGAVRTLIAERELWPAGLITGLATVLSRAHAPNQPALNTHAYCRICNQQGLVSIETIEKEVIQGKCHKYGIDLLVVRGVEFRVLVGGQWRDVRRATVGCSCSLGREMLDSSASGNKGVARWSTLADIDLDHFEPVGGWPSDVDDGELETTSESKHANAEFARPTCPR